jgi:hypothetical protein
MTPEEDDMDYALQLELAEHTYLLSLGWTWGALNGEFFWKAPPNHQGSALYYSTRAHAINSVKRWMGLKREVNVMRRSNVKEIGV